MNRYHYRLELLNDKKKTLSTFHLEDELTILGRSPHAHFHLHGKNVGPLHIGIKKTLDLKTKKEQLVLMDLGGPSPLLVDGKSVLEKVITEDSSIFAVGEQTLKIVRTSAPIKDIRRTAWIPVTETNKTKLILRVRIYDSNGLKNLYNSKDQFTLNAVDFGLNESFNLVEKKGKSFELQIPKEWIALGGRIGVGKEKIVKLDEFATRKALDLDTVYRIQSGGHTIELLVAKGETIVAGSALNPFPKELRKPFILSLLAIFLLFGSFELLRNKEETKVEEPYKVYARIQNVPVEKIMEPEPDSEPQAGGGGSGSPSNTTSAPKTGQGPSKLALSLTGGIQSLVGNMLSKTANTNVVVAENGESSSAAAAASTATGSAKVGALSAVNQGAANVTGAAKLGSLGIAGSGKGFSGGSGTGLGAGIGTGVGNGVGNGIGKGSFKLVEEESIVDGGLDKSVIAAVIQNNLSQIKYCYERQLIANPDLFGKVVMSWVINASGNVESTTVKQSTLGSDPVEQCMAGKISGWKFPSPKNGTKVNVSYPFLFKSTK